MSMWADTRDLHEPRFAHKLGFLVFTSPITKAIKKSVKLLL
jgi:hypothetical protein